MYASGDVVGVNASVDRSINTENFVDDNQSVNHDKVMSQDFPIQAEQKQSSIQFYSPEDIENL